MYRRKTRITKLDVVVTALILLLAAYIVYRLTMKLNYKWNWSIIPQYLFFFDEAEGRWKANVLMQGLFTTIRLTVWSTLLAIFFGFITGIMRTTPRLFNRLVGRTYVELIRNVPPLVLIFIFYFFVSDQILPLLGAEEFIRSRSPGTQKVLGSGCRRAKRCLAHWASGYRQDHAGTCACWRGRLRLPDRVRNELRDHLAGKWTS